MKVAHRNEEIRNEKRETTPKRRKKNDIFFLKNCLEDFLKMMPWAKKQETKLHSIVIKKNY